MKAVILFLTLLFLVFACKKAQKTLFKSSSIKEHSIKSDYLKRDVNNWIYLPRNYDASKTYPILVMHDGQNVFFDSLSFAGEWQADETLDSISFNKGVDIIAVGIENGGEARINELTPYPNEKYGGGNGNNYVNYIEKELMPLLESKYSISKNRKDRAMIGSSLGGLITFYDAFTDETTFSKFGVYSPSLWYSNDIFELAASKKLPQETRMLMMISRHEEDEHLNVIKMDSLLNQTQAIALKTDIYAEGEHKEWFWAKHLYDDLVWLFDIE